MIEVFSEQPLASHGSDNYIKILVFAFIFLFIVSKTIVKLQQHTVYVKSRSEQAPGSEFHPRDKSEKN